MQEKNEKQKEILPDTLSSFDQELAEPASGESQGKLTLQRRHPRRKYKVLLLGLAKVAISVTLVAWIISTVDTGVLKQRLIAVSYGTLFLAVLLELVAIAIASWRWKLLLGALDLATGYGTVFRLLYIGQFINQVLPANLGGDAYRTWRVFRGGSRLLRALMAVALDRLVALIGLALLAVPSLYILSGITKDATPMWIIFALVLGVAAGVVIFLVFGVFTLPRLLLAIPGSGLLMAWISEASNFARTVLLKPGTAIPVIVLAVSVHGLAIAAILVLAEGMDIPLSAGAAFALLPPVILASAIPVSYAGWGIREGAMVVFLGYAGIAPEAAISLSLLFGGVSLLASLPAVLFFLASSGPRAGNSR